MNTTSPGCKARIPRIGASVEAGEDDDMSMRGKADELIGEWESRLVDLSRGCVAKEEVGVYIVYSLGLGQNKDVREDRRASQRDA